MEAPPMEVFRIAGFLVGFAIAYYIIFRPKNKQD